MKQQKGRKAKTEARIRWQFKPSKEAVTHAAYLQIMLGGGRTAIVEQALREMAERMGFEEKEWPF